MTERTNPAACLRCGGTMNAGFLMDRGHAHLKYASRWISGEPERNWFGSLKLNVRKQFEISADRCTKCGWLDLYARTPQY